MSVWIDQRAEKVLDEQMEAVIRAVVADSLCYEGFSEPAEVSVSIVTEEEIRSINRQFRGIDRVTDVLSFPLLTFEAGEVYERNEDGEVLLGDIIICLQRAEEQAASYGHSLKREIAFLTAHSMLHLLGYDHMEKEEEKIMFEKQEEILQKAGIPRQ